MKMFWYKMRGKQSVTHKGVSKWVVLWALCWSAAESKEMEAPQKQKIEEKDKKVAALKVEFVFTVCGEWRSNEEERREEQDNRFKLC